MSEDDLKRRAISALQNARSVEGLPYTWDAGVCARRPLAGEKLTMKKLTVRWRWIRWWRRTPDRDSRSFLNPVNPKRTWNCRVPPPFRGTKKMEKIWTQRPGR